MNHLVLVYRLSSNIFDSATIAFIAIRGIAYLYLSCLKSKDVKRLSCTLQWQIMLERRSVATLEERIMEEESKFSLIVLAPVIIFFSFSTTQYSFDC